MNCRTVRSLTSAYLEDEVTAEERDGIDEHLQSCSRCSVSLFQTSRVTSLLAGLPHVAAPADFTDRVLARVTALADEERPRTVLRLRWPTLPALRVPAALWAPGLAAAAVLLAFAGVRGFFVSGQPVTVASAPATPVERSAAPSVAATRPNAGAVAAAEKARAPRRAVVSPAGSEVAQAAPPVRRRPAARSQDESANPLGDIQAVGPGGFALQGHDVLDPVTDVDLVYEQVSPERAGLVRRAGTLVPNTTPSKRRYWTF